MKSQCTFPGQLLAATLFLSLCITGGACGETPITGETPVVQLSGLSIEPGAELSPPFSATITSYAATVPNDLPSIAVMAETEDSEATIAINGMNVPAGAKQSVSLGPPGMPTPIEIVVSSADGESITYVITVTRLAQCAPKSGDDCCPGDYQEQGCGSGNCGKQSRLCSAAGKWGEWSACGVNSARAGQVCRVKGNPCDPAEACGAAIDCPADYIEYPIQGYAFGCWQMITSPSIDVRGRCTLPSPPYPPGYTSCKPDHVPTADHICVLAGYKGHQHGTIVNYRAADDIIGLVYWNGSSWQPEQNRYNAMLRVTCLK